MKMKYLACILLLLFLTVGVAAAQDNATVEVDSVADAQVLSDGEIQKEDYNASISFPDEIAKDAKLNDYYYVEFNDMPRDYNDMVSLSIDGVHVTSELDPDRIELHPYDYEMGNHTIKVSFLETDRYIAKNITKTFNVVPVAIYIPEEIKSGSNTYAQIIISNEATGTATVKVDGTQFKKVNINPDEYGTFINLDGLEIGTHEIEIIYSGDSKYPKTTKKAKVNVTYNIYIDMYEPVIYKHNEKIRIEIPKAITTKPYVTIDGKNYTTTYEDGAYVFNTNDLNPGTYKMTVICPADGKNPEASATEQLTIVPFLESSLVYGNAYFNLILPEDAKGNLSVYVNGELYKTTPVKGNTTISLNELSVGMYRFKANYTGDDYLLPYGFEEDCWLHPYIGYNPNIKYNEDVKLVIRMNPDANVSMYYRYDSKSSIRLNFTTDEINLVLKDIKKQIQRDCTVYIKYIDLSRIDLEYEMRTFEDEYYISVEALKPKFTNQKTSLNMYYCDGTAYKVKLYDETGQLAKKAKVSVTIGSKKYTAYTDTKGVLTIKFDQKAGKYTLKLTYAGKEYTTTAKTTVNIKKILSLNTVKVKKSAKKLVLTAKLSKKLKGKTITFKFNGKTYKAKTNSKGIAKYTIKKSVLKKLKVGKKITYTATYVKETVKKTAKVLK